MEFKQIIGRRRSIRYFQPWRPVERGKIQAMLEAALLASRGMNVPIVKAIVAYRDQLTQEERDSLKTPTASVEFDLAPVYILWYHNLEARMAGVVHFKPPTVPSGFLLDAGAFSPALGWSRRYLTEVILPEVLLPPGSDPRGQRGGNVDAAMAMEQALLCAFDEGLGACLVPFDEEGAQRVFGVPDIWEPVLAMLVGYPAESWEAGGQRPRPPFEEIFFEGRTDVPFRRDPQVVQRLQAAGMIQEQAPLPWRQAEVRSLARMFHLPEG